MEMREIISALSIVCCAITAGWFFVELFNPKPLTDLEARVKILEEKILNENYVNGKHQK
jgi:hypothetical protein